MSLTLRHPRDLPRLSPSERATLVVTATGSRPDEWCPASSWDILARAEDRRLPLSLLIHEIAERYPRMRDPEAWVLRGVKRWKWFRIEYDADPLPSVPWEAP